ncbi:MAG: hypothetical protein C4539_00320 [Ignavibacteriales bacterium]|nr:MAG: hypothetical protein C4539_00320 [Ignavibacteriales bacterium]
MQGNNFRLIISVTWLIILICLVSIGIMIKVYLIDNRFDHEWDFLVYSIPVFISSFVFVILMYNLRRAYIKGSTDLKDENCIVHWKYAEEEWKEFNNIEWRKIRLKLFLIPLACILLFIIIGWFDDGLSFEGFSVALPYIIVFFISISAAVLFYNYMLYRRTKVCPREVLIGTDGFLYGGYFNGWKMFGTKLGGVKLIQENNAAIEFDIRVRGKYGYTSNPLRVPVPIGHEYEAEKVISEINKQITSF